MNSNRQWTVLAYLAGDNSLSVDLVHNLREMRAAGIGPDQAITVVAQYDPAGAVVPPRRYVLTEGPGRLDRNLHTFVTDGENSGDPRTLLEFLRWGITEYPAQHYLVVLSGHGSGAVEQFFLRDEPAQASLSLMQLRDVMLTIRQDLGRELDIVALDSCLMGMVEVGYQLRGTTQYLIASEGLAPNTGWPYHRVLSLMTAEPDITAKTLAQRIPDIYARHYADCAEAGLSTDLSACDVGQMKSLALRVTQLAAALRLGIADETEGQQLRDAIIVSHWEAQTYKQDQYTDLNDFCALLASRVRDAEIQTACEKVRAAIQRAVISTSFTGNDYQHSHGLAIYFPWAVVAADYAELDFATETGWREFLQEFTQTTRRAPRRVANPCAILKPSPASQAMVAGAHRYAMPHTRYAMPHTRYAMPHTRYAMPHTRGAMSKPTSIKNEPTAYYDHLADE